MGLRDKLHPRRVETELEHAVADLAPEAQEEDVLGETTSVVHVQKVRLTDEDVVRIDRRSVFGNPFTHLELGRTAARWKVDSVEEAITSYERWFRGRVKSDAKFRQMALNLRGKRLACWCAPGPCHGDVIVRWLGEQAREDSASEVA